MKIVSAIGIGVLFIACIFGVTYVWRKASNAVTPLAIREAEPGIRCATLVTADGAAIDCWETEKR